MHVGNSIKYAWHMVFQNKLGILNLGKEDCNYNTGFAIFTKVIWHIDKPRNKKASYLSKHK